MKKFIMAKLKLLGFYFLFLFSSIRNFFLSAKSCPENHRQILLKFKFSLIQYSSSSSSSSSSTDEIVFDLETWDSNSDDFCQWDRVICDHSPSSPNPRRIIELDLSKLYLESFEVLAPVFNINSLTKLDLSKNFLHGEVPVRLISNLSLLVDLDLSYNNLSGQVPCQLFRNLQHLDLSGNSFSEELCSTVSEKSIIN